MYKYFLVCTITTEGGETGFINGFINRENKIESEDDIYEVKKSIASSLKAQQVIIMEYKILSQTDNNPAIVEDKKTEEVKTDKRRKDKSGQKE